MSNSSRIMEKLKMISKTEILKFFIISLVILNTSLGCSQDVTAKTSPEIKLSKTDSILNKLNEKTAQLISYQCRLEYLFSQPLFDSKTLRKGSLYYKKDSDNSVLRMNFNTIKQDDEPEEKQKSS